MFFLCRKELYIVKEPLTKNRTCQTWRERQVCACRVREPLDEMIAQMPPSQQERYYVSGYLRTKILWNQRAAPNDNP